MKIGLLKCYSVPESLIHISGSISDTFNNFFEEYTPYIEIEMYDAINGNFPLREGVVVTTTALSFITVSMLGALIT